MSFTQTTKTENLTKREERHIIVSRKKVYYLHRHKNMKKGIIISILTVSLIGLASASIQIQSNLENAVQTIKQIFITSDGLDPTATNKLVTINEDSAGTLYIKNKLETDGVVTFNGISDTTLSNQKLLVIDNNNNLQKIDNENIGWTTEQREESTEKLYTHKQVGIGASWTNHQLRVWGNSVFRSGDNIIYLFPANQINSNNGWFTSHNNNLKINSKTSGTLYLNYDVDADTTIKGNVSLGTHTPTSTLDIQGEHGYSQLRLREQYIPTSSEDPNGNTGDITRWHEEKGSYIYVKTPDGWMRSQLEVF